MTTSCNRKELQTGNAIGRGDHQPIRIGQPGVADQVAAQVADQRAERAHPEAGEVQGERGMDAQEQDAHQQDARRLDVH